METGKKGEKQFSAKDLEIDPDLVLHDDGVMDEIHKVALTGKSIGEAMDTLMPVPKFDDILILGAQLVRFPKADDADVNIRTVIGKNAKKQQDSDTAETDDISEIIGSADDEEIRELQELMSEF